MRSLYVPSGTSNKDDDFIRWQRVTVVRVGDLNAEDSGSNPWLGLPEWICPRWSQDQIHNAL